jgi:transposase
MPPPSHSNEVAELRRANEILKAASAFFAAELDRPLKRS